MKLFKSNVLENGEKRRKTFQNIRPSNINISDHYCFSISDIDGIVYLNVSSLLTPINVDSSGHQEIVSRIRREGDSLEQSSDNARWGAIYVKIR